jgi:hypothetical protein
MSSTNVPKKGKSSVVEKSVELPYDASKIRWVQDEFVAPLFILT